MVCQRCFNNEEVHYRAHSDIMDIMVCPSCAEDARQLEITVEYLDSAPHLAMGPIKVMGSRDAPYIDTPPRRRRPQRSVNSDN
ncbi:MAG TPA: hypothetical protein VGB25_01170 [Candidatus Binatia bacterium]